MELLKIWEIIARRKKIVIIVFLLLFSTVLIATKLLTPIYEAKARVYVENDSEALSSLMSGIGLGSAMSQSVGTSEKSYETEIALATLRPLLISVIDELNLKGRDGERLKPEDFIEPSILNKLIPRPYIEVVQYEESDILEIVSKSSDPSTAAKMSNMLAELYMKDTLEQVRREYRSTRQFIDKEISIIEERYKQSLMEKKDFMIEGETVDLQAEIGKLMNKISELEEEYRANEIATAQDKYGNKEIGEVTRKILAKYLYRAKRDLVEIPLKSTRKSEIDLSLAVNQNVYSKLLEYRTQVGIAESMTISKIRLVESAFVSDKPVFPKKVFNSVLGLFLGLFLGLSAGFLTEYMDDTVKKPEDLKDSDFSFLGAIPKISGQSSIIGMDPNDPVYESYRAVLTSIYFTRNGQPPSKLLVSSILPKEGSSTTVVNLGVVYAKDGKNVLLVDTDFRRPSLHKLFNFSNKKGFTDLLWGRVGMEAVVQETGIKGLSVLTSGPTPPDPVLLFKSKRMGEAISHLEEKYDYLIFDSAPILVKNDAVLLMKYLDDLVLVLKSGGTSHQAILKASEIFKSVEIRPSGVILNHA